MLSKLSAASNLIHLSGLNFRQQRVACVHCSWNGLAGELRSCMADDLVETMSYACPKCLQTIAVHTGLSTSEVMQEMQEIGEILKKEISATRYQPDDGASVGLPESGGEVDFTAELDKMLSDLEISERSETPAPQSPVTPEVKIPSTTTTWSQSKSPGSRELDFAEVRARLAGIA
jgi:hypothetical protein